MKVEQDLIDALEHILKVVQVRFGKGEALSIHDNAYIGCSIDKALAEIRAYKTKRDCQHKFNLICEHSGLIRCCHCELEGHAEFHR